MFIEHLLYVRLCSTCFHMCLFSGFSFLSCVLTPIIELWIRVRGIQRSSISILSLSL